MKRAPENRKSPAVFCNQNSMKSLKMNVKLHASNAMGVKSIQTGSPAASAKELVWSIQKNMPQLSKS
jgi:hypothetical protein